MDISIANVLRVFSAFSVFFFLTFAAVFCCVFSVASGLAACA